MYQDFGKPKAKRDRSGRKNKTKTGSTRSADQTIRADRKKVRSSERVLAKRAAAKAASAGEAPAE